jgi:hypothetical protein
MKKEIFLALFLFTILISTPLLQAEEVDSRGYIPVLVKVGSEKVKSVDGLDQVVDRISKRRESDFKAALLSKKRFSKKLGNIIEKLGTSIEKAMKMSEQMEGKYELTEVEVGLSVSGEAGISNIVVAGASAGIVLIFTKE